MSALVYSGLLTLAVGAAYWWVRVPELNQYSLQAIAYIALLYLLIKRLAKAKFWHVLPSALSVETALLTFGFLLLIGSTGGVGSLFYPLTYVLLFFIVFSNSGIVSIVTTVELMLFYYALTPGLPLNNTVITDLITLPLVTIFFLFAKRQHEEIVQDRIIIKQETVELTSLEQEDAQVRNFVQTIQDKLGLISQLLAFPLENQLSIQGQLAVIQLELQKLQRYLKKEWFGLTVTETTTPYEETPS